MNTLPGDGAAAHDLAPRVTHVADLDEMDGRISSIRQGDHHLRAVATRRVVVVGSASILVEALAIAIDSQPDMETVARATSLTEATPLVDRHSPDVVVVHVPQPDVAATGVIGGIRTVAPRVKVVLLVADPGYGLLSDAAEMGVAACLSLDSELRGLLNVMRSEMVGAMVVDASFLPTTPATGPTPTTGQHRCGLTPRELQVLALLAEGYGQQAVACHLVISVYTARGHVKNVLRKLGAHSQLEAIAVAARMGLLRRSAGGWDENPGRPVTTALPFAAVSDA